MGGRTLRRILLTAAGALLAMVLSGCVFEPAEDLYALPALPEEYAALQSTIQATMNQMGAEYATISSGRNTSTVQMLDLDGNGQQETAAVFLRVTGAEEKPMRVCLFRRGGDDTYTLSHVISGDGASINSVLYEDLTGNGVRELVISWQMSSRVYILSAYELSGSESVELLSTTYNESYLTVDLDGVAGKEILVFQRSSTVDGENRAEYYRMQEGVMTMSSTALLSDALTDVRSAVEGTLLDGTKGVYVTSTLPSGVLTDILVLSQEGLKNVTRDQESAVSLATLRTYTEVAATDINADGVLEIPMPVQATNSAAGQTGSHYVIYWRQFDSNGKGAVSCATYHCVSDGWYLMLPDSWPGRVYMTRDDSLSSRGERAVVFSYWPDQSKGEPQQFLTLYKLTGSNRYTRAKLPGRVVLYSDSSAIYCAALREEVWECGIAANDLSKRFHLITEAWSTQ